MNEEKNVFYREEVSGRTKFEAKSAINFYEKMNEAGAYKIRRSDTSSRDGFKGTHLMPNGTFVESVFQYSNYWEIRNDTAISTIFSTLTYGINHEDVHDSAEKLEAMLIESGFPKEDIIRDEKTIQRDSFN